MRKRTKRKKISLNTSGVKIVLEYSIIILPRTKKSSARTAMGHVPMHLLPSHRIRHMENADSLSARVQEVRLNGGNMRGDQQWFDDLIAESELATNFEYAM